MKNISIIAFIALLAIGLYIRTHKEEYRLSAICKMYEEFKAKEISGIIQKKFKDEDHHLNEMIIINNEKIDIGLDKSGIYDFIIQGDSIEKKAGSDKVDVFRNDTILITFSVDFGCTK